LGTLYCRLVLSDLLLETYAKVCRLCWNEQPQVAGIIFRLTKILTIGGGLFN